MDKDFRSCGNFRKPSKNRVNYKTESLTARAVPRPPKQIKSGGVKLARVVSPKEAELRSQLIASKSMSYFTKPKVKTPQNEHNKTVINNAIQSARLILKQKKSLDDIR